MNSLIVTCCIDDERVIQLHVHVPVVNHSSCIWFTVPAVSLIHPLKGIYVVHIVSLSLSLSLSLVRYPDLGRDPPDVTRNSQLQFDSHTS